MFITASCKERREEFFCPLISSNLQSQGGGGQDNRTSQHPPKPFPPSFLMLRLDIYIYPLEPLGGRIGAD